MEEEEKIDFNLYTFDKINLHYYVSSKSSYQVDGFHINNESLVHKENLSFQNNADESNSPTRDWNEEFQKLIEDESDPQRLTLLGQFGKEFVEEVSHTAQIIIDEFSIPDQTKRSILPTDIGGIAGGTKFIHNGIIYKLAVDDVGLYKSDESAIKVASHDFHGSILLPTPDLSLPLTCLVDYCGMRILAIAKIPISSNTLVGGSDNAGETVSSGIGTVVMRELSSTMFWKKHQVIQRRDSKPQEICAPIDLEVHLTGDKRVYAVDLARVLPPVSPGSFKRRHAASYLVNHFRLEFLERTQTFLNPDAYSPFCKDQTSKQEVDECTKKLHDAISNSANLLEELIQQELQKEDQSKLLNLHIQTWFHAQGFNLRYLGKYYSAVKLPQLKSLVLSEMVTRVLKDLMKKKLRGELKQNLDHRLEAAQNFMNQVFQNANNTNEFWQKDLKEGVQQKYEDPFSEDEMSPEFELIQHLDLDKVLAKLQTMVGVKILPKQNSDSMKIQHLFPLEPYQLQITISVKHRAAVCSNYADNLKHLAELCKDFSELQDLHNWCLLLSERMEARVINTRPSQHPPWRIGLSPFLEKLSRVIASQTRVVYVPQFTVDAETGQIMQLVKAISDYEAQEEDEVSFSKGDILEIENEIQGWCVGKLQKNGKVGLFPKSRVTVLSVTDNMNVNMNASCC